MNAIPFWYASPAAAMLGVLALGQTAEAASGTIDLGTLSSGTTTTYTLAATGWSLIFQPANLTANAGCYITNNNNGNACSNINVDWSTSGKDLTLLFSNPTSTYGLIAGQKSGVDVGLYFNFAVDTTAARAPIEAASMSFNANKIGYSTTDNPTLANTYANEYLCSSGATTCQGSGYFASIIPTAYNVATTYDLLAAGMQAARLNVSKYLASIADASNANSGFNIGTMTQVYSALEPVSVSLLGTGAAAAAFARRWRRRSAARHGVANDNAVSLRA